VSDIGWKLRKRWPEVAWAVFALANLVTIVLFTHWETIPFHFIWVSLTLLYGFRVWSLRSTMVVLVVVVATTAAALAWTVTRGHEHIDEVAEVPLMAAMFLAMVWHARRRQAADVQARRLAEADRLRSEREREFVRDASHELRTPITIARGHAELLAAADPGGQVGRDAAVILDELARLSRISDRLLILSAASDPRFLRREAVPVRPFLEEVARRWSAASTRRWDVEVELEGTLDADPERLRIALDALLENAMQHTSPGDRIALRGHGLHGELTLEVADSGEGIPVERLGRIFDRFARLDDGRSRAQGGTGLGLAIVKALVEAHGGSVQAVSRVGQGSTFTMRIPGFAPEPPQILGEEIVTIHSPQGGET
jgi:signal transduction histidine kinase